MNNNYENTIESFIEFCDEMKIGIESYTAIRSKYKKYGKEMDELQKEIKKGYYLKKIIKSYQKMINISKQFRSEIEKEKDFEAKKDIFFILSTYIRPIGRIAVGILGSVYSIKNISLRNILLASCSVGLLSQGIIDFADATKNTIDLVKQPEEFKSKILKEIDKSIKAYTALVDMYTIAINKYDVESIDEFKSLCKGDKNFIEE